jgi:adenylate kinase
VALSVDLGGRRIIKKGEENSFYLRDDDKEDVIRKRLEVFKSSTMPVLNYYQNRGEVIMVKGIGSINEINESIIRALKI